MTQLKFIDAISLANAQQAGQADGTAFYLPGGNAFRAWPLGEVRQITTRYRLPIFVRSNPRLSGVTGDVDTCLSGLSAYGVPKGTLVCWDSEVTVDAAYMKSFWAGLHAAGYHVIDYGSQSVVFGNHNPDGYYWGADWTGTPHVHLGDQATQFISLANWDVSLFSPALPLWDTSPPEPPIVAYLSAAETGAIVAKLPVITPGMSDAHLPHWYIRGRVQPILNATWNKGLAVDGVYGPKTQAAIGQLQSAYGIPAAEWGKIGEATWSLLLTGTKA